MKQLWVGPWLACIVAVFVVFACEDAPRQVQESEVADAFADELCGPMFSCGCADQTRYASRDDCRQQAQEGFARLRSEASGLVYDPLCYGEMLDALDDLGCGPPPEQPGDECLSPCSPYHGDRPEGASCERVFAGLSDCARGLSCNGGICTDPCRRGGSGDPCGAAGCRDGLWCDQGASPPTCRSSAGEGESCAARPCAESLWCDRDVDLCRLLPGPGEACAFGSCRDGAFCVTNDPDTGPVCQPLGALGDPCMGHLQCSSGYCPTGHCAALPGEGESCAGTLVCADGLSCREDVCAPPRPAVCTLSLPWPDV